MNQPISLFATIGTAVIGGTGKAITLIPSPDFLQGVPQVLFYAMISATAGYLTKLTIDAIIKRIKSNRR